MTTATIDDTHDDGPPGPGLIEGLDDLAAALRGLRAWAGNPSYAQIARDVAAARRRRGVPRHEATVGRVTVYDCFRDGRRRINVDLIVDIATALGVGPEDRAVWRLAGRTALRPAGRMVPQVASLPDRPQPFVGRTGTLARLTAPDAAPVQVVHGLPGTGKSAVAVTAAHDLLDAGEVDAVVHIGLSAEGGRLDPFDVMAGVLRLHDAGAAPAGPTGGLRTAYLDLLASRRTLLLLDDVASPDDVELLVPAGGATRVVITSRWSLDWPDGVDRIELSGLDAAECGDLLARSIGDTADVPEQAGTDLQRVSGGLPLAVNLIGARAARRSSWSIEEHLRAYQDQLDMLQLDEGIHGALAVTYAELDPSAQHALRLLALHPSREFGLAAAAGVLARSDVDAELETLTRAHLLDPVAPERWEMHALVQVFARRMAVQSERPVDRADAEERIVDHYLTECTAAVAAVHPSAVGDWPWVDPDTLPEWEMSSGAQWLRRERAAAITTASWAAEHHFGDQAMHLASVLTWHLWDGGDMSTALALHQTCRATAITVGDRDAEGLAERNLGMTHVRISNYDQARPHLDRALAIDEEIGNMVGLASVLNASAIVSAMTGDYDRATDELTRAVDLYREHDDPEHVCGALSNLAVVVNRTGDTSRTVQLSREAAAIAAEHGWVEREKWAQNNIAGALADGDDPARADEAIRAAKRAGELARQQGDDVGIAYAQTNLATAMHLAGDIGPARDLATSTLAEIRRLTIPDLEASILNNLGTMATRDGRVDDARSHFEEALQLAERIDEAFERQRARDGLASLDEALHQPQPDD